MAEEKIEVTQEKTKSTTPVKKPAEPKTGTRKGRPNPVKVENEELKAEVKRLEAQIELYVSITQNHKEQIIELESELARLKIKSTRMTDYIKRLIGTTHHSILIALNEEV